MLSLKEKRCWQPRDVTFPKGEVETKLARFGIPQVHLPPHLRIPLKELKAVHGKSQAKYSIGVFLCSGDGPNYL